MGLKVSRVGPKDEPVDDDDMDPRDSDPEDPRRTRHDQTEGE